MIAQLPALGKLKWHAQVSYDHKLVLGERDVSRSLTNHALGAQARFHRSAAVRAAAHAPPGAAFGAVLAAVPPELRQSAWAAAAAALASDPAPAVRAAAAKAVGCLAALPLALQLPGTQTFIKYG